MNDESDSDFGVSTASSGYDYALVSLLKSADETAVETSNLGNTALGKYTVWRSTVDRALQIKSRRAADLLKSWLSEDSDYDEKVGKILETASDLKTRFRK